MNPTPVIKAFLLADHVFRQDNGKWCVNGIFNEVYAPQFPMLHPSLGVFVVLIDAEGEYNIRIEMWNSQEQRITTLGGIRIGIKNRLQSAEFGLQTYMLPLPAEGPYFFKLLINDELMVGADARLNVVKR